MSEDSGEKDGDVLENWGPLHSTSRRRKHHNNTALQVKWVMPWQLLLIHRHRKKNAFRSEMHMFGHQELP